MVLICALLMAAAGLFPDRPRSLPLGGVSAAADYVEEAERELGRLANEERARAGLAALALDDRLVQTARAHAREMAERKQLSHQFPGEPSLRQRIARSDIRVKRVGENVAYDETAGEAHQGLMHSPGHRANILNAEYNAMGVGVVRNGGLLYIAQNFAHRLAEKSTNQAEDEVAAKVERLRRGYPRLERVRNASLRQLACTMARHDRLETKPAMNLPRARYVLSYTATDPENLPANAERVRQDSSLRQYSVGACFERTEQYPTGVYWVLLVFY